MKSADAVTRILVWCGDKDWWRQSRQDAHLRAGVLPAGGEPQVPHCALQGPVQEQQVQEPRQQRDAADEGGEEHGEHGPGPGLPRDRGQGSHHYHRR